MKTLKHARPTPPMVLSARTAADLMTPNPVSIHHGATVPEAAAFLAARGISAAPVIDEAGRPIGVVSRTDILQRQGQRAVYLVGSPEYYERLERPVFSEDGARDEAPNRVTVRDVMTPVVFCVGPETPAAKVVEKMLALEVRRLFVVDGAGVLIGVVSAIDVLRKLCI
ncbi:MAG TPA: CBS domain-containing protein [Gemmataceae bacterium]|nr:CBS domain-containing protein [Gemmataceae bacterium]